jgi:Secretion system C-terminal sorting domain
MLRLLYIGQLIGACRSVKNYAFLSGKNVFFIPSLGSKHFYGRIGSTILFLRLNEIKNITKQKHTTMWHKLLAGALLLFLTSNSTAQQMTYKQWLALTVPPIGNTNRQIDCSPTTISACNKISNNVFSAPAYDPANQSHVQNPFGLQLVTDWYPSHGSANIYDGVNATLNTAPPFTGAGYTRMGTFLDVDGNQGEGIAQKIPQLIIGRNYAYSFFLKRAQEVAGNNNPVQNFYVVLMHCADYNSIYTSGYVTPSFPVNSQIIYCETGLFTTNWKRIFNSFTANDDYDMIWIFPKTGSNPPDNSAIALFSYPELIDISNFSAGSSPALDNCSPPPRTVTIGPTVPNCSVYGAVFKWYGPNGLIIPAPANQQIDVDPSIHFGTWTLKMEVPSAVNVNNPCSPQAQVAATVNVPNPNNTLQMLSPTCQYINYNNGHALITQNLAQCANTNLCNASEILIINVNSSELNGNIWTHNITYFNNTNGFNAGFTNYIDPQNTSGSVLSHSNNLSGYFVLDPMCYSQVEITLTNSITNSSRSLFFRTIPIYGVSNVCHSSSFPGYKIMLSSVPPHSDYTYQWTFPSGFNVINPNELNVIYNNGSYTGPYPASAVLNSSNIHACGVQTQIIPLILNPPITCNARMAGSARTSVNHVTAVTISKKITSVHHGGETATKGKLSVFPSPAISSITLNGEKEIREIVIHSASGKFIRKEVAVNSLFRKVDISSLNAGLYFVTLYYKDGTTTFAKFIKQ